MSFSVVDYQIGKILAKPTADQFDDAVAGADDTVAAVKLAMIMARLVKIFGANEPLSLDGSSDQIISLDGSSDLIPILGDLL